MAEKVHNTYTKKYTSSSDRWCKLSDIPVHGDTVTGKATNTVRILFEDLVGFVIPDKIKRNKIQIQTSILK